MVREVVGSLTVKAGLTVMSASARRVCPIQGILRSRTVWTPEGVAMAMAAMAWAIGCRRQLLGRE